MNYPTKNDIISAVKCQQLIQDTFFQGSLLKLRSNGIPKHWTGGFSIVFQITKNGETWAFKVWHIEIKNIKERYEKIYTHLKASQLPYFVDFSYVEKGLLVDGQSLATHRMKWIDGQTLNDYLDANISNPAKILEVAKKFKEMVGFFHKKNIAHGDLQHGNILVKSDGSLLLIDYDSMFVSDLQGMSDIIKGQAGYQHPARNKNQTVNSKLDYFSELVIYLSLIVYSSIPTLWNKDTDWLLFSKEDLEDPSSCPLFIQLQNSSDPQISNLTKKLLDFLKHDDISLLKPLEEILENKVETKFPPIDSITDKF